MQCSPRNIAGAQRAGPRSLSDTTLEVDVGMSTESTDPSAVSTFIWGSCVSRDTFKYLPARFALHRYVARQSLISAGNSVEGISEKLSPLKSAFQQKMVQGDLGGNLFSALESAAPTIDLVLIDLVDERGGVIHFPSGYATKLNEFWGSGGREASRGVPQVAFGSDEHFTLWTAGATQLVNELARLGLTSRTVVLRANWASTFEDGQPMEIPEWMMPPVEADAAYARYFDHLEKSGLRVVSLPQELARSRRDHEWGASPFHYQDAAYVHFANEIERALQDEEETDGRVHLHLARRDTAPWGRFTEVDSPSAINDADLSSGLLTVWQDGLPFDVLIDDAGAETTLVSFHAALGGSGLRPPIFTARTVSNDVGVNRIFISDPGLMTGKGIGVAWYLGTSGVDATAVLREIISALHQRIGGRHLVFFGMSGGGFAALNLSHEFPGSLAIPVNPQTRILEYAESSWNELGIRCFGARSVEESRDALERHPRADLRRIYSNGFENSVLYVQNASDGHTRTQLYPWLDSLADNSRVSLLFGAWGQGHTPPPARELKPMLARLADARGDWSLVAGALGALQRPTRVSASAEARKYRSA